MHIARLDAYKRENKRWKIWFTLEKLVTLHSQIRDGNRSMSDNPYLFRASYSNAKTLSRKENKTLHLCVSAFNKNAYKKKKNYR